MSGVGQKTGETVSFAEHLTRSAQFDQIFKAGMALVEAAAAYLDGPGRRDAKALSPGLAMIYATESMRLTTRLLELASWLLVRRSLKTGEISQEEARIKRRRIKLNTIARPSHVASYADLPARLRELIEESYALNDRIIQIDRALEGQSPVAGGVAERNPVGLQIAAIAAAFASVHSQARH